MKSKITIFSLVLVLLMTGGCKKIGTKLLLVYSGAHEPRIETTESLRKYMQKKDMTSDNVFTTQNLDSFQNQMSLSGGGVPEVLIFSKNLDNITYRDTILDCNAPAFRAILGLDKNKTYKINENFNFDDINTGLCDLEGNPTTITVDNNADFIVVIYWAKYVGKLNKEQVNVMEKDAIDNTNANIQVVKINLDYQSFWGLDEDDYPEIKF
ncbi:MAG: hypothetical protein PHP31_02475 [Lentimicrobiaceae bacterium]|nr:hypothetical protein [Lentimicrobiaceae bacterium]